MSQTGPAKQLLYDMSHRNQPFAITQNLFPLLILLVALFLQMSYLIELRQIYPDSLTQAPFCGVDAKAHLERAKGFLDGSVPGDQVYPFTPLYPFYLIVFKEFLGHSLWLPIFVQALLQLVGIAATYALGKMLYSPLTGLLAMAGLASYNYYTFYLPCYDQALLTTPTLLLALVLLFRYQDRRNHVTLFVMGGVLAIAILSRPTILMTLPFMIGWLFLQRDSIQRFSQHLIILIIPLALSILPFTWHNYQVSGQFLLISNNFGINLFTGNNLDASGFDTLAHAQSQPGVLRFLETVDLVYKEETTFEAEVFHYLRTEPNDAFNLLLTKSWLWFGETELPLIEPFFPLTIDQSSLLRQLPLTWQAVSILAILGLFVRSRVPSRQRLIWVVYGIFSAFTILFFIQMRFRLPFLPFIMISAAAFLANSSHLREKQPGYFWTIVGILIILSAMIPGVGFLAFLVVTLGLWRYLSDQTEPLNQQRLMTRWLWGGVLLCLIITTLWQRAEQAATDVGQSIDIYLGPPLVGETVLGQTFEMDCDGFNRLDITLGVFNQPSDQPVTFGLTRGVGSTEILVSETFEGTDINDYQIKTVYLEPLPNSSGETFFFYITSPTSTADNTLTARGYSDTPIDYYPKGTAFAGVFSNLQPIQADFAFTAYCQLSPWQKITALFSS
ncbi:MAG: glycosyltransferase family 39 protein [Chloroflexota bacterium]